MYENNVIKDKVELKDLGNGYRALFSVDDIDPGDILIQVPLDMILTLEVAKKHQACLQLCKIED
jgi:hypothetical protein